MGRASKRVNELALWAYMLIAIAMVAITVTSVPHVAPVPQYLACGICVWHPSYVMVN